MPPDSSARPSDVAVGPGLPGLGGNRLTDLRYLATVGSGKAAHGAAGLLAGILLARTLGPTEFGLYSLAVAVTVPLLMLNRYDVAARTRIQSPISY